MPQLFPHVNLPDRIENDFAYHKPTPEKVVTHGEMREKCKDLALYLEANVPASRELSTALTHLEEVMMWANAGIARNNN